MRQEEYITIDKYKYDDLKRKEKALDIIKNKNKIINERIGGTHIVYFELTQEEYDLLKEVLL